MEVSHNDVVTGNDIEFPEFICETVNCPQTEAINSSKWCVGQQWADIVIRQGVGGGGSLARGHVRVYGHMDMPCREEGCLW